MDLNQLLYNHQLAMMNARRSRSDEDHSAYFDLVGFYAKKIQSWRSSEGLPATTWLQEESS